MSNPSFGLAILAASLLVVAELAWAHKLKTFATAEGTSLVGYAYFSPGGRPRQVAVTVTDADGRLLATTTTDDQGYFRIEAEHRVDHRITVDGGDGHVATYTVTASELPDTLPAGDGPSAALISAVEAPTDAVARAASPALLVADTDWRVFIDQSLSRQIRPLREQIDAYQEKIWWHDVLGGIGYILGLAGLAFGLSERRRRTDASPSTVARRNLCIGQCDDPPSG